MFNAPVFSELLRKYDQPVPRYTSYPTVPMWDATLMTESEWIARVTETFDYKKQFGLYVHLPFCERLCTYCACNKHITRNHEVEQPYLQAVLKEWAMYKRYLGSKPILTELHLGGGTPTFFAPEKLRAFIESIFEGVTLADDFEGSFEAHPGSTTQEHLQVLYDLGFRRISIGVQDFSDEIMRVINREQTLQQVEDVTRWAREMGYSSINWDLVYGLPFQTLENIYKNAEEVRRQRPDRVALYSYAHVPWLKKSQRAYDENDLPTGEAKRALYELARTLFQADGYEEIGMDHFALVTDSLSKAAQTDHLHRNFMGYTTHVVQTQIGLGASAISDTWNAYAQNIKEVGPYLAAIDEGRLPLLKSHHLTGEDMQIRRHILNLMCRQRTDWYFPEQQPPFMKDILIRLRELEADGLVQFDTFGVLVTPIGRPFLRNICAAFDKKLWQQPTMPTQNFSRAI